ncbi:MAG: EAL domain-containing protein [Gammaproteobacteria bacterium]
MHAIKERGCRFALDDFGSGLASFGYLKTLPVDYLKIDGHFVKDIPSDPFDNAVVQAIQGIAETLGLRTIAESVESDAILERVKAIGIDFAQGYTLAEPRPLERSATPPTPLCKGPCEGEPPVFLPLAKREVRRGSRRLGSRRRSSQALAPSFTPSKSPTSEDL